jgi:hypothetical protein
MTIGEQLKLVVGGLSDWCKTNRGWAFPAGDVPHLLDLLRSKPGVPGCGVMFWTEDPHGEYAELGKVMRGFKVVISRYKGFKLVSGESLTEGAGGGPPMFDLIDGAVEACLALRVEDESGELQVPQYQGTGPFEAQGLVLDAFEIRFGLFAQRTVQGDPSAEEDDE